MVEGRTALRSHSRKKGQAVPSLRRTPKASGWMERIPPSCRKYREALRGGSSWAISQPRKPACLARAATKAWTATVCSTFLSSCLLLPPDTLRQSKGSLGTRGATLHRFLATATEVRSLRASTASPRSVRVRRPPAPGARVARPKPSRGLTSWDALGAETPSSPARSLRTIQGQSESRSRARFSAGQKAGQHMVGDVPAGTLDGEVGGRRRLGRLGLRRKRVSRLRPVDDRAQVDGGVDGGRAPHRVAWRCRDRLPLQGQEAGNGSAGEHPAGMSQPHLVGHEHEDGSWERAVDASPSASKSSTT